MYWTLETEDAIKGGGLQGLIEYYDRLQE